MSDDFPLQYARAVRYSRVNHEDLAALLNGVHEKGSQHSLPSLVLADWLEENEMPAHAEFIRRSVEETDGHRADPEVGDPQHPYMYAGEFTSYAASGPKVEASLTPRPGDLSRLNLFSAADADGRRKTLAYHLRPPMKGRYIQADFPNELLKRVNQERRTKLDGEAI